MTSDSLGRPPGDIPAPAALRRGPLGFPEHADRPAVLGELHARPLLPLSVPRRIYHFAFMTTPEEARADREAVVALATQRGVPPPAPDAKFHRFDFGPWALRWEQHTEFATYMWKTARDADVPFARPNPLASGEIAFKAPGQLIAAVHMCLVDAGDQPRDHAGLFHRQSLCAIQAADRTAYVATDFVADPHGFTRFLVESKGMTETRTGRLVQRVLELEIYRTLALLGLPVARRTAPLMQRMEFELAAITREIADKHDPKRNQELLTRLGKLAAELEAQSAATAFRFGATRAYHDLVKSRLDLIREEQLGENVSITAFFRRRLDPAIDTCNALEARENRLAGQLARAADLLRTGIQFDLEQQNRNLLRSMDRRARLQLRLQQTVEGLSVAAISYYVVGLVTYLAKGAQAAGGLPARLSPEVVTALAVPLTLTGVWLLVSRIRSRFHKSPGDGTQDDG
ncbi:MAG: DUF3422 domain-containing protein [Hyphomicrobiaceae bacterium]|nr:DUF3422 domain-containing protein [Hyphomicrobiaceae bacterium]